MNFRTTLIIIVLLAGIAGAYFLFFQQSPENTSTSENLPIHQVYGITQEQVQQMEVTFTDTAYQDLKLVKDATGNWHLKNPFQADADSEKVNQMLDDILNKRVKQTLEVTALAQYGLDTPSITLSLWTEQASPAAVFSIGKKAINFSVYVKERSEAHIFLIESSALDDLTKSPTDLRDRSVIKFNTETVSNIQLTYFKSHQSSKTVNCEKRDGTWRVTHPIKAKADTQEIEDILSELRLLQVSTFEADQADADTPAQLEKTGLDTPRIQIELTDGNNTHALDIGAEVPPENGTPRHVYVKSVHQHAIYTVSDDIYQLLSTSVFDLRDKRIIDFQRTDTIRIEIRQGQETTVCSKNRNNVWELQTPTGKVKADAQAVDDLLFGVDSLEAAGFVDNPAKNLASYGLASPSIAVAFTQRGQEKPAVLRIGDATKDGTVYVKAEQSDQVARVERGLIDKIALGAAWLRDKQILNFHIDDAIRFTLHGEESLTCQRLGTNWRLTSPVKEEANNTEVNAIIYELDDLRADTYVPSEPALTDAVTGFSTPQLQITVELRNRKVYTLQVGNQTEASGRFYARLQHEPNLIFLLNAERVPKLKTTLTRLRMP
ncbi:DUF4340 domain-containing protein [Candidatus Poribacteria bacterium]|nr:DUF4340 domain-containing protein [Candidatus Poribacteria bacterium]MYA55015.1 DUF4340 domain-containing protein [Candidatus Poribacteria bacterium]